MKTATPSLKKLDADELAVRDELAPLIPQLVRKGQRALLLARSYWMADDVPEKAREAITQSVAALREFEAHWAQVNAKSRDRIAKHLDLKAKTNAYTDTHKANVELCEAMQKMAEAAKERRYQAQKIADINARAAVHRKEVHA